MKLKIGDYLIIAIILVAVFMLPTFYTTQATDNLIAVVTKDGQEIRRIILTNLTEPITMELQYEYYDKITAEQGRIRFTEADCPEKICVNTGWLSKPGQAAVCLPNGLIIRIEGSDKSEIDAYLR
jgi:hypothetical protein